MENNEFLETILSADKDKQLDILDTMFIRKLIKLAMSEETSASELSIIQKYLKDNGVTQMFKPKEEFIELTNLSVPFLTHNNDEDSDVSIKDLEDFEKGLTNE